MTADKCRAQIDWTTAFEARRWAMEMPALKFPKRWRVQIIPPFGGAVVRFVIYGPRNKGKDQVSVYFDAYEQLGYYGEPHWEAYPINNNNERWAMRDWPKMFLAIDRQLFGKKRK